MRWWRGTVPLFHVRYKFILESKQNSPKNWTNSLDPPLCCFLKNFLLNYWRFSPKKTAPQAKKFFWKLSLCWKCSENYNFCWKNLTFYHFLWKFIRGRHVGRWGGGNSDNCPPGKILKKIIMVPHYDFSPKMIKLSYFFTKKIQNFSFFTKIVIFWAFSA